MPNKRKIYQFLRDLAANNSKEWMDENRDRYHEAKDIWLAEIDLVLRRLAKHDPYLSQLSAKDTIMRINNNRMFHPDKPVYKDNFGFSPGGKDDPALYVHVSPSESFVGGGVYRPDKKMLKSIREAIDYNGEELLEIANKKSFLDFYGGLAEDEDQLKTSPRDYDIDHKHIELLRRKNFTAIHRLTQEEVVGDDFVDIIERAYLELRPLNEYLGRAMTV